MTEEFIAQNVFCFGCICILMLLLSVSFVLSSRCGVLNLHDEVTSPSWNLLEPSWNPAGTRWHAPIADVELAVEPVVEQAIVPAVPHVEPWERIWRLLR